MKDLFMGPNLCNDFPLPLKSISHLDLSDPLGAGSSHSVPDHTFQPDLLARFLFPALALHVCCSFDSGLSINASFSESCTEKSHMA